MMFFQDGQYPKLQILRTQIIDMAASAGLQASQSASVTESC